MSYPVLTVLSSSLVANSKKREVLASFKAYLFALEKDAAVPTGDLGSAPPPKITKLNYRTYK